MTDQDTTIAALEAWLSRPNVKAIVDGTTTELLRLFAQTPERASMAMPIPQAPDLPEVAKSFRLFALRPKANYPFERHPNSHQWVRSLQGQGTIELKQTSGDSLFHRLSASEQLLKRWSSVSGNTWHRPQAAGEEVWLVATFHSAANVMDEYEDVSKTAREEEL